MVRLLARWQTECASLVLRFGPLDDLLLWWSWVLALCVVWKSRTIAFMLRHVAICTISSAKKSVTSTHAIVSLRSLIGRGSGLDPVVQRVQSRLVLCSPAFQHSAWMWWRHRGVTVACPTWIAVSHIQQVALGGSFSPSCSWNCVAMAARALAVVLWSGSSGSCWSTTTWKIGAAVPIAVAQGLQEVRKAALPVAAAIWGKI